MDIDVELERLRAEQQWDELATLAISQHGPKVLGFLVTLADHADAADAFAQASEDLWRGLPNFEGRSSIKTWFYALARHALSRIHRSPAVRRRVPLSAISEQVERVRSATRPHLRSEAKRSIAAIRAELPEQDRALLVLRIDRDMSWYEIAHVMADHEVRCDVDAVRIAARLRKRFQAVKETIRERALQLGLIESSTHAHE